MFIFKRQLTLITNKIIKLTRYGSINFTYSIKVFKELLKVYINPRVSRCLIDRSEILFPPFYCRL